MATPRYVMAAALVSWLCQALAGMAGLWFAVPDPFAEEPPQPSGPPPGHPERLCADVPLSRTELALQRQLRRK
ncbi:DUF6059 family protein [Streptomyces sp. NPDC093097]|uniref:DUF6059 family protein n=1 Tax=Streptomyces sp. NPDC093097 TaxID=3366027 RepID=UPI003824EB19